MQADIRAILIEVAGPVFLADIDHANARLRLHVRRGGDLSDVRRRAQAAIDAAGQPLEVIVRSHVLRKLAFPRSLEHWLERFQLGDVIHDPTMIVARAQALLLAARACREAMGSQARGIFFDPARRTLLVLAKGGRNGVPPSTQAWVRSLVDEAWARAAEGADPWIGPASRVSVQVVGGLPKVDLVPVDTGSASTGLRIRGALRRWLAPLALVLAAGAIAGPAAAKYDGRQPLSASSNSRIAGKTDAGPTTFGILSGLSMFADGQSRYELDAFASSGLKMFFGSAVHRGQGVLVAQQRGSIREQVLYDVDGGPANAAPGS